MSMSLEDVAVAFRESLPAESEISVFRIDALDRTGIPVSQAGNTGKALRQIGRAAVRWNNGNIEQARARYRPNDKR